MDKFKLTIFYIIFLIQYKLAYSYSSSKTNKHGDISSENIPLTKNIRNHFKSLNSSDAINLKKKEDNIKIRKNVNKLFNTLFPNETEDGNKKSNFNNNEKRNVLNDIYGKTVSSSEKSLNDKIVNIKKRENLENRKFLNNEMKIEYIKNENKTMINEKNALGILGNSEILKNESKFAIFSYLKDFFENFSYMKNFKIFIENFFNKYDQRVAESSIFFNFDELLF